MMRWWMLTQLVISQYMEVKALCHTPGTHAVRHVNYISVKQERIDAAI